MCLMDAPRSPIGRYPTGTLESAIQPPRRAALAFIFVTVVIDVLAMGIVIPVLPKLVESFKGGDTASAAEIYGVFGAAGGVMEFLFMPVVGALSDRFRPPPRLLIP